MSGDTRQKAFGTIDRTITFRYMEGFDTIFNTHPYCQRYIESEVTIDWRRRYDTRHSSMVPTGMRYLVVTTLARNIIWVWYSHQSRNGAYIPGQSELLIFTAAQIIGTPFELWMKAEIWRRKSPSSMFLLCLPPAQYLTIATPFVFRPCANFVFCFFFLFLLEGCA